MRLSNKKGKIAVENFFDKPYKKRSSLALVKYLLWFIYKSKDPVFGCQWKTLLFPRSLNNSPSLEHIKTHTEVGLWDIYHK